MTHHGLLNVHKSRLKYFGRCQVGISASTSEGKKNEIAKIWEKLGKFQKNLGKSGKSWENLGKVGKIWEKLGKSGKIWENGKKSGKFQEKSGISLLLSCNHIFYLLLYLFDLLIDYLTIH